MQHKPHVLIAGAGIGGLALALALLRRGFTVEVFEQASELREFGAGINLTPNGHRVLDQLGIAGAVRELACVPSARQIRHWQSGKIWPFIDVGPEAIQRWGYTSITVYRPDLHQPLIDAVERARPGAIRLNHRVTGFEQDEHGVRVQLADGRTFKGDVLVGADGVHSPIRQGLFGPDRPEFTGVVAWRGVIPMQRLPPHLAQIISNVWVGPGRHSVQYPLRGGAVMNFVGLVERDDWLVESWTERGTHAEWARDFAGWHEDIHSFIRAVDVPFKWALMSRTPMSRWSTGRVTLLGDACHPMLPFLAQGAAQSMEDGLVLARVLERYGVGARHTDLEQALVRYEDLRRDRTTRAVLGSAANAKRFHHPDLANLATAEAYIEREFAPAPLIERYDWLFSYDAMKVEI
ncbi:MAG: monooxygenase [Betaproteobacteria bacterium]|nr:monooxygenase [Betaproteobacteria bacterium]